MDRLWAPWRMEYIMNEKSHGCIFCIGNESDSDRDHLVLYRTPFSLVMLNRYPYTNGHLMVSPYRHTANLNDLSNDEMLDLFKTVSLCRDVLEQDFSPQGFNIGLNLGRAAGAGVEDHLHFHVVPRWNGDTNFMTVIADLRVVPEGLLAVFDRLVVRFGKYNALDAR